MKTTLPAAIGALLLLLCACAQQGQVAATPTHAPLPTRTALPTHTPPPAPSPAPTTVPAGAGSDRRMGQATPLKPAADLAIQAQPLDQVVPGRETVYTLTVHNHGPALATGIVLTDVLPPGVIPVWTQSARPLCGRQANVVGCNLGDLQGGDAATVTLDLSVVGTETLITGTQLPGLTLDLSAPTCAVNQGSVGTYVTCQLARLRSGAEVNLRTGISADAGIRGSLVHTATVRAKEADTDPSNNRAAATLTLGGATPLAPTAVPTITDLVLQAGGPSEVIAGQPFTYTYTVTNRGALDASGVAFRYTLPPATILSAYSPQPPLCQGRDDILTCYLRHPDSNKTVTVTLAITGQAETPMILALDPLMPAWPACVVVKERSYLHLVDCELGILKPGQATRVQLVIIARGVQERAIANTASVNVAETEANPLDNTSTTTITVQVKADLSVRSTVSGSAIPGKTLTYTLTVANSGPSDSADVVLTDILPLNTTFVSAVASLGEGCQLDPLADAVSCELGNLNGNQTATVTIVVALDESLDPGLEKTITHSASVLSKQVDPDQRDNQLTQSIPISTEYDP